MMEIEAEKLEKLLSIILKHQKALGNTKFRINQDYFWDVPSENKYSPYENPPELTLGQLTFDWENLQKMLEDDDSTMGYGLVWLGNLLKTIGENYIG